MGGSNDHEQKWVNRSTKTQEEPTNAKIKFKKGGGSQNEKLTCVSYGKRQYGKYLAGTSGFFGCGKDYHKVRYCPIIADRERESSQVSLSATK